MLARTGPPVRGPAGLSRTRSSGRAPLGNQNQAVGPPTSAVTVAPSVATLSRRREVPRGARQERLFVQRSGWLSFGEQKWSLSGERRSPSHPRVPGRRTPISRQTACKQARTRGGAAEVAERTRADGDSSTSPHRPGGAAPPDDDPRGLRVGSLHRHWWRALELPTAPNESDVSLSSRPAGLRWTTQWPCPSSVPCPSPAPPWPWPSSAACPFFSPWS